MKKRRVPPLTAPTLLTALTLSAAGLALPAAAAAPPIPYDVKIPAPVKLPKSAKDCWKEGEALLKREKWRQAEPYLREEIDYDPEAVAKQWKDPATTAELLDATRERLAALDRWEAGPMEAALRSLAESRSIAAGKIFQPLRVALTGLTVSPGIFDVLVMLGRDRALRRLERAVDSLQAR